mmetsp:Transcript_57747/g.124878  ORF Transcript_57747/g.124878 Transcript_57747/m.124878 type:complete len:213 (+) Transcript_57747:665-1303(+)
MSTATVASLTGSSARVCIASPSMATSKDCGNNWTTRAGDTYSLVTSTRRLMPCSASCVRSSGRSMETCWWPGSRSWTSTGQVVLRRTTSREHATESDSLAMHGTFSTSFGLKPAGASSLSETSTPNRISPWAVATSGCSAKLTDHRLPGRASQTWTSWSVSRLAFSTRFDVPGTLLNVPSLPRHASWQISLIGLRTPLRTLSIFVFAATAPS